MAKKLKGVTLELPDSEVEEESSPSERAAQYAREASGMSDDDAEDFFQGIDELRGTQGVAFQVYRTEPLDRAGFCFEYPGGTFTLQRLTRDYGPGTYRVRVKGTSGRYIPGGGTLKIAAAMPIDEAHNPATLTELMARMEERQAAQQAARQGRFDKLTELAIPGLLGIIAAIVGKSTSADTTALIAALKPVPGPSLNELTGALANLKTLQGEQKGELDVLEKLFRGLELMKDFTADGRGASPSSWIDVLRDLVKEIVPAARPMLENLQAQSQARAEAARKASALVLDTRAGLSVMPSALSLPAQAPLPVQGAGNAEQAFAREGSESLSGSDDMFKAAEPMIREQLQKLLQWAIEGKKADLYAEVFMEELPPIVMKFLSPEKALELLRRSDWWDLLKGSYPRLEPHFAWFDRFRSELISLLEDLSGARSMEEGGADGQ